MSFVANGNAWNLHVLCWMSIDVLGFYNKNVGLFPIGKAWGARFLYLMLADVEGPKM